MSRWFKRCTLMLCGVLMVKASSAAAAQPCPLQCACYHCPTFAIAAAAPADGLPRVTLCVPRHAGGAWYLALGGDPQVAAACHAVHLAGAAAETVPRH